ncbi:hypothetical protein [Thermoactinomyces sp. CICC 23799]|uniref:hypothetical protein n=1 Tax=Thermoactinomyces sp. CICC 23799 TaxID=2767429 RepID=UPI0018DD4830|nr:hypothetical protein [Thermoactinomyces sp. CICC 23799]MBH8600131.1 hypothetical protein [Thermoactinomyces sp. CICC 23799]
MPNLTDAEQYFDTFVLHTEAWDEADETMRIKALNQAEKDLSEFLGDIDFEIPVEAIYEQALWILCMDDAIQKAELGVTSVSVDGVSVSMAKAPPRISPRAVQKIEYETGYNPYDLWTVI